MAAKEYSSYNGITELRREYEHFNKYLIGKQLSDDLILQAYKHEIKKFKKEEEIKIELDDEYINKAASQCLLIVRDIVNSGKSEQTAIYIGALLKITGLSSWKELKTYFKKVKDFVNSIDQNAFDESPNDEIESLAFYHGLDNAQMDTLSMFLLLKLVRYVGQNWESPPLTTLTLQGGMLENELNFVSQSTFRRYHGSFDQSNIVLQSLLKTLNYFKNNISGLLDILSIYKIKYNSTYIKKLGSSADIAIKLPLYKGVDYESILKKTNRNLLKLNSARTSNEVDLDKVVLFLFMVERFNRSSKDNRYNVSSNRFSTYLGDSKVVSSIRDAFEEEGIFHHKLYSKAELRPNSYKVSISFDVDTYKVIENALLIDKLNHRQTIILGSNIEYKLELLNSVADVINSKARTKPINFTQVFLKSGMTSPLLYFLNIINALKYRLKEYSDIKVNENLINAFSDLDVNIADKLYTKLYNRLLGLLNDDQIRPKFIVPILDIISDEEVNLHLKEKFTTSYLTNNPDKIDGESEIIRKELQEVKNDEFIHKLKVLTSFDEDISKPI